MTAELAMGIPTVLGVIALGLSSLRWGMDAVAATTVAAETSYAVVRGEDPGTALAGARDAVPGATWTVESTALDTCTVAVIPPPLPLLASRTVRQCVSG